MPGLAQELATLVERGGPVMIALLALSVISGTLILERAWFWLSVRTSPAQRNLPALVDALGRGERAVAEKIIARDRGPFAEVARRLLRSGVNDASALDAVETQRPRLERFMVSLSTIITAAPLLGILGTVVGIIQSFQLLGDQTALIDPRDVSAGIATALLTTAAGLIVSLVTLFPYMALRVQVNRALGRLETIIAAAREGGSGPTA